MSKPMPFRPDPNTVAYDVVTIDNGQRIVHSHIPVGALSDGGYRAHREAWEMATFDCSRQQERGFPNTKIVEVKGDHSQPHPLKTATERLFGPLTTMPHSLYAAGGGEILWTEVSVSPKGVPYRLVFIFEHATPDEGFPSPTVCSDFWFQTPGKGWVSADMPRVDRGREGIYSNETEIEHLRRMLDTEMIPYAEREMRKHFPGA